MAGVHGSGRACGVQTESACRLAGQCHSRWQQPDISIQLESELCRRWTPLAATWSVLSACTAQQACHAASLHCLPSAAIQAPPQLNQPPPGQRTPHLAPAPTWELGTLHTQAHMGSR